MVFIVSMRIITKKQAMIAAEDLRYGNEVIEKIKAAKSDAEIERIMNNARHEKR